MGNNRYDIVPIYHIDGFVRLRLNEQLLSVLSFHISGELNRDESSGGYVVVKSTASQGVSTNFALTPSALRWTS